MYASVEDVDFLVGCLAENPRPDGYLISETAFYVFIMNASRRLLCDRFYQVGDRVQSAPGLSTCTDRLLNALWIERQHGKHKVVSPTSSMHAR